jgi:hypothetical protein
MLRDQGAERRGGRALSPAMPRNSGATLPAPARWGVMNRVNTVRSGNRSLIASTTGNPFHPGSWPGTLGRKDELHIDAEVDRLRGQVRIPTIPARDSN